MLWAALLGEEGVPLDQLPFFYDKHAHSEKLAKVLRLRRRRSDTVGQPVLDVSGHCLEVRCVNIIVLADIVVGRLASGHHFLWRQWQGGREGEGGKRME